MKSGTYSASTAKVPNPENNGLHLYVFSVDFTSELVLQTAPSARIVVGYITAEAKLIVDTIDFTIEGGMANKVRNRNYFLLLTILFFFFFLKG